MAKTYNVPHRDHVIKSRLSDEEYEDFLERCRVYEIPQAELIRQSMQKLEIHPVIKATTVSEPYLTALGKLLTEGSRIGNNMNQIAHALNAGRFPDSELIEDLRKEAGDIAVWKQKILKEVGDQIDNDQTYRL